jgi:hypothetical protein
MSADEILGELTAYLGEDCMYDCVHDGVSIHEGVCDLLRVEGMGRG